MPSRKNMNGEMRLNSQTPTILDYNHMRITVIMYHKIDGTPLVSGEYYRGEFQTLTLLKIRFGLNTMILNSKREVCVVKLESSV